MDKIYLYGRKLLMFGKEYRGSHTFMLLDGRVIPHVYSDNVVGIGPIDIAYSIAQVALKHVPGDTKVSIRICNKAANASHLVITCVMYVDIPDKPLVICKKGNLIFSDEDTVIDVCTLQEFIDMANKALTI